MPKLKKASDRHPTEPEFKPEDIIKAFQKSLGSVADAARLLDCTRQTLYVYCRNFPEIQVALDDVRNTFKDTCVELAKDNHLTALLEQNPHATAYEIAKLEPKADSVNIDPTKLTVEELAELRRLLEKGKPDGAAEHAP